MFVLDEEKQDGGQGGYQDDNDGDGDQGESGRIMQLEAELKKRDEELSKLRSKDLNFSSYRKKSEDEKKQIRESMTNKEKLLLDKIEFLETQISASSEEASKSILKSLSGGDDEFEKKIQANYERLTGDDKPRTTQEINERYREAFALTQHQKSTVEIVNPLNQFTPFTGSSSPFNSKGSNFADTAEGQGLAKDLGLNLEKKK